jgi:hypothetical protein
MLYFSGLPAQAQYGGGTGEANDPYQIATAEDLMLLGESPEDYDKDFILTADIDLDPNLPGRKVFNKAVIAPDSVGGRTSTGIPFKGVFNGNGYTISHLSITGGSHLGLFGNLWFGARIYNLGMEAVRVNGTGNSVGGLVGWNYGGIIIMGYSTGTVTGVENVGGLVGYNWQGSISISYSAGVVKGVRNIGGLVGDNIGSITTSYSTGTVGGNEYVGGLVGDNPDGSVIASFWNMESSGQTTSAGGTGLTTAEMQDIDTYLNAGWDFADEVLNGTCDYWQISPGDYPQLRYRAGESPVMPEGLGTVEEPYLIRNFRDLGTIWFEPLAYYRLEAPVDLSGIIWSMAVVPWFGGTFDGNGHMISNLHIHGSGYLGLFGQLGFGAEISNLGLEEVDVNGTGEYVGGLVGWNEGSIAQSLSTGMVNGDYSVGGLVGENRHGGSIITSYSTGSVNGDRSVGGLVGDNFGSITASYSTSTVTGHFSVVGGLVGFNSGGSITASYSTGTVTGSLRVGGLVGSHSYGSITMSYSTGAVIGRGDGTGDVGGLVGWIDNGNITTSFWDMQTSGRTTSASGIGKTTAEMQTASTFLDIGWDFIDETTNGTEDIWWILEGQSYPRLWWELTEASFIVVDDFESYNDLELGTELTRIYNFWWDGYDDPKNGSTVGYENAPFCERTIVHGGFQSMPYFYDNTGTALYSEATRKFSPAQDWTEQGVGVLSLWFYGDPNNTPEPMYVGIANANGPTVVVYHDNPDETLIETWTEWTIDLQEFATQGVNLTNVNSISIGFGDKNSPPTGGSGLVFFDDIRLYRLATKEPEP